MSTATTTVVQAAGSQQPPPSTMANQPCIGLTRLGGTLLTENNCLWEASDEGFRSVEGVIHEAQRMGTTTDVRCGRGIIYTTLCKGGNCETLLVIAPPPSFRVLHPSDSNPETQIFSPHRRGLNDRTLATFHRANADKSYTRAKSLQVLEVVPFQRLAVQSELLPIHIAHTRQEHRL